jgi:hypothetical protein
MPRYFFNIEDHVRDPDDEGTELADAAEARLHAIAFAAGVLKDDPDLVWDGREFMIQVKDEGGEPIVDIIVRAEDRRGAGNPV